MTSIMIQYDDDKEDKDKDNDEEEEDDDDWDHLWWKTTYDGRRPMMEDDFRK